MSFFSRFIKSLEAVPINMKITGTERVGSHIQKVTLSFLSNSNLEFPIGSYIQPMVYGWVSRAYSIAECTETTCTIVVSFSGRGVGARFFANAPIGTDVSVYGPFSDFPYHYGTGRGKIFLATGTGVAPFVRMVTEAIQENLPSLLVLGVPREYDIPYREYFENLARLHPHFHYLFALSRPEESWTGARGYITQQFGGERDEWLRQSDVYVCGVPLMVEDTASILKKIKVPKQQVYIQKFG